MKLSKRNQKLLFVYILAMAMVGIGVFCHMGPWAVPLITMGCFVGVSCGVLMLV